MQSNAGALVELQLQARALVVTREVPRLRPHGEQVDVGLDGVPDLRGGPEIIREILRLSPARFRGNLMIMTYNNMLAGRPRVRRRARCGAAVISASIVACEL